VVSAVWETQVGGSGSGWPWAKTSCAKLLPRVAVLIFSTVSVWPDRICHFEVIILQREGIQKRSTRVCMLCAYKYCKFMLVAQRVLTFVFQILQQINDCL
jgi:hypothetical protein